MKIDSGESLIYSYLRHVKKCFIVQTNWKPSGNWFIDKDLAGKVYDEFIAIQQHKAFKDIFKTNFEHTIRQTEVDVLGMDPFGTMYAVNVIFNELGINYGSKTDTRNRVVKNLLRAHLVLDCFFPGREHVIMFCAPKVTLPASEILQEYFRILDQDFSTPDRKFLFVSNEEFRDEILMETVNRSQDEFDTNELFLRSFKLLTLFAGDVHEEQAREEVIESSHHPVADEEPADGEPVTKPEKMPERTKKLRKSRKETQSSSEPGLIGGAPLPGSIIKEDETAKAPGGLPVIEVESSLQESSSAGLVPEEQNDKPAFDEKTLKEIEKVKNRVPRWFARSNQTNSRILIAYMQILEKKDQVTLEELKEACREISGFSGNYSQMSNIADINHGKIFCTNNGMVTLWEPVSDFIIREYIAYKASYYKPAE